ncbi:hypothetical protein Scep_000467 [Stephania cephalantha]|uniref:Large ribosomal subunit protein bL25 beta domain-containing protein n=1 Tax=Stephania cephalantha TaxID=152367 RepID=A0AAP0L6F7_9MAGN
MARRLWAALGGGIRVAAAEIRSAATAPSSSASYHTIQAIPREHCGPRVASKDRAQGRIPAVVFSRDDRDPSKPVSRKHLLTTERKQIKSILKQVQLPFFCSTTFHLQIRAGSGSCHLLESGVVLPIKARLDFVHRNAETGDVLNLVFQWAEEGSEVNVDVPVVFKGQDLSPGIKKVGGHLNVIRESLTYRCPVEHIPPKIEVDVSNLDIGDRLFMRNIEVHPSLKLLSKVEEMPVCKVVAAKPKISKQPVVATNSEEEPAIV